MHPGAYDLFLLAATATAVVTATAAAMTTGLRARRMGVVFILTAGGGLVGARLLHMGLNVELYREDPSRLVALQAVGFSLYGGLALGAVTGLVTARILRLPLWRTADAAVVGAGAGVAVYRIGCFTQGCCFGEVTGLPWGVTYPALSPAWSHQLTSGRIGLLDAAAPVHPTQLYELGAGLMAVVLALLLIRRGARPGIPFLAASLWFTAFRWFNWELRVPPSTMTSPDWFYPAVYALLLAAGVAALALRSRRESPQPPPIPNPRQRAHILAPRP